jgi:hypothetical protein
MTVNLTYSNSMFTLFLEATKPIFVEGAGITNVYFGQSLRVMNWQSGGKFLTIMNSNPKQFLNMPNSDSVRMAMLKPGSLKEGGEILLNASGLATAINDVYQCYIPIYREKKRKFCAELPEYTRRQPESTCAEVESNK